MDYNLYLWLRQIDANVKDLRSLILQQLQQGKIMSQSTDNLTAQVQALIAAVNAAVTNIQGLVADIAALKQSDPQVQALTDQISAEVQALQAATAANPA